MIKRFGIAHWVPLIKLNRWVLFTFLAVFNSTGFSQKSAESRHAWVESHLDRFPKIQCLQRPVYPQELLVQKIVGDALIDFSISVSGEVTKTDVVQASHPLFGLAAVDALKKAKFAPAFKLGEPVIALLEIPAHFELTSEAQPASKWGEYRVVSTAEDGESNESISAAMAAITHVVPKKGEPSMSQHNAYLYFCKLGHREAIPALIRALSEVKYTEESGKRWYDCTWLHLRSALQAQTGKFYGFDQAAWQKWWDSEGKDLPEHYFDLAKFAQRPPSGKYESDDDQGVIVFRADGVFGYKFAVMFDFFNLDHLPSTQGRYSMNSNGRLEIHGLDQEDLRFRVVWHPTEDSFEVIRLEKDGTLPKLAHYEHAENQRGIQPPDKAKKRE